MAKLLEQEIPDVPEEFDQETLQIAFRQIEIALTNTTFPGQVEGIDENRALTWFAG